MKLTLLKFWKDEEGATAIEYALIAGLIAVVIIAALTALGGSIKGLFEFIQDKVDGAITAGGGTPPTGGGTPPTGGSGG